MTGRSCHAVTHAGMVRSENQDALLCRNDIGVYAVADGAGGHDRGKQAANTVIEALTRLSPLLAPVDRLDEVRRRLHEAHQTLLRQGADGWTRDIVASTVAVLLVDARHFVCLWVGDSRIYLLRGNELLQLTRDHSLVQEMVDAGALLPAEAQSHPNANVITRAVGAGAGELQIEKHTGRLCPGDKFLLCSDGLNRTMRDDELRRVLRDADDAAAEMLRIALARNARDNVSIIVVD